MTKEEFYAEYQKLHRAWPEKFKIDNPNKLRGIFEIWQEIDAVELKSLVDRMLQNKNPDFDLVKTGISIKRSKSSLERTKKILDDTIQINEKAYHEALASFKAESLVEAVMKARKHQDGN